MNKKYILFSLEEDFTEELAKVLGNKTCRKILDLLADEELSESDISKKLNVPLNTIGYGIKKLKKTGLVEEKKHYFSVRGKRIPVYRVSNKDILISSKKSSKNKLKNSLSVIAFSSIFTFFILWYNRFRTTVPTEMMRTEDIGPLVADTAQTMTQTSSVFGVLEWFLIGIWFLIILFVILSHVKIKNKKI